MRRVPKLLLAAACAATVAGGAVLIWNALRPPSLTEAAEAYLHALEAGDADTLAGFLPSTLPDDAHDLAAEAAAEASMRIRHTTIAQSDESTGHVRAHATLGTKAITLDFTLSPRGRRLVLGAHDLVPVTVETDMGSAVEIGGRTIPADTRVGLFPGEYTARAAPTTLLRGEVGIRAVGGSPVHARMSPRFTQKAASVAAAQLAAYEDDCAADAAAVPPHCGISVPWPADMAALEHVRFRIDQRPHLELAPDGSSFVARGGTLVATAEGRSSDGSDVSRTYRTDDWMLRGRIRFTLDRMALVVL